VTEWQAACLTNLKIDRWIMRQQSQDKLCVLIDQRTPFPLSVAAKRLLEAMLKVKGLSMSQIQLATCHEQVTPYSKIWVLSEDEDCSHDLSEGKTVLQTKSLSQLLAEPSYKKEVYEALQQWF
jgi:DNA polymerase III psi subunit